MRQPSFFVKVGVLVSSLLLATGIICYGAGVFSPTQWFGFGPSEQDSRALVSSSKSRQIAIPVTTAPSAPAGEDRTLLSSSKSARIIPLPTSPAPSKSPTP